MDTIVPILDTAIVKTHTVIYYHSYTTCTQRGESLVSAFYKNIQSQDSTPTFWVEYSDKPRQWSSKNKPKRTITVSRLLIQAVGASVAQW